ncbi:MAG: type transport system ATP-binding protein [Frankiales bacterium]|nr:type transport system ATP-binding protein [Frankiales bacterium]
MRTPHRSLLVLSAVAAATAGLLVAPSSAGVSPATTTNACITSVPDPDAPTTPQKICYTLFKPAGADAKHQVPVIFHSHGWGGSRTTTASSFAGWLKDGFAVLSFDQRGFGEDGGKARVENPAYEGKDVMKLVDLVAKLPWVKLDSKGDPRLGAIGGSYGGGYQFVGAFTELMTKGKPVFDALAPQITWYDLKESLAPQDVPRTEWSSALTAAGARSLPNEVLEGFVQSSATGMWAKGQVPGGPDLDKFFFKNGPKWHVSQGRHLNIPVLFGQGETDNLFPLHQGLENWANALTPSARSRSIFVGYNGGHTLPAVVPRGYPDPNPSAAIGGVTADPCSKQLGGGTFDELARRFMREKLLGQHTGLKGYGLYHLATADSACVTVSSVKGNKLYNLGTVATPEAAGGPVGFKIADGPIRIAGTPYLAGQMTAVGVNNRAFYALGVGTNPADVQIVQNNMLPFNSEGPVLADQRTIELPSVAVDVPKGKSLFLVVSAVSDMFAGFGSRTPGAIVIDQATVNLPVVHIG